MMGQAPTHMRRDINELRKAMIMMTLLDRIERHSMGVFFLEKVRIDHATMRKCKGLIQVLPS